MSCNESDDEWGLSEEQEHAWNRYLDHFENEIYPMFNKRKISLDAALIVWFVNRLRNALPDDNAGNDPWGGGKS